MPKNKIQIYIGLIIGIMKVNQDGLSYVLFCSTHICRNCRLWTCWYVGQLWRVADPSFVLIYCGLWADKLFEYNWRLFFLTLSDIGLFFGMRVNHDDFFCVADSFFLSNYADFSYHFNIWLDLQYIHTNPVSQSGI